MIRSSDILRAHALEKRVADHRPYRPLVELLQQLQNVGFGHIHFTGQPRRKGVAIKRGGPKRTAEPVFGMQEKFAGSSGKRRIGSLDSFVRLQGRQLDGGEVDLREVHLFLFLWKCSFVTRMNALEKSL